MKRYTKTTIRTIDGAIRTKGVKRSQEKDPRERPRSGRSLVAAPGEATAK
jgi:hypothetical protein